MANIKLHDKVRIIYIPQDAIAVIFDDTVNGDVGVVTEVGNDGLIRIALDKSTNKNGWWYPISAVEVLNPEMKLISEEYLFIDYVQDGTDPTREGGDVEDFINSDAGKFALRVANDQLSADRLVQDKKREELEARIKELEKLNKSLKRKRISKDHFSAEDLKQLEAVNNHEIEMEKYT